jgi:hypothetical protein
MNSLEDCSSDVLVSLRSHPICTFPTLIIYLSMAFTTAAVGLEYCSHFTPHPQGNEAIFHRKQRISHGKRSDIPEEKHFPLENRKWKQNEA